MKNSGADSPKAAKVLTIAAALLILLILVISNFSKKAGPTAITEIRELQGLTVASLHGTVMSIESGRVITMEVSALLGIPLMDSSPLKIRTVQLNQNTQIYEAVAKDPGLFRQELAQYNRAKPGSGNLPPSGTVINYLSINDLKVGDSISVREADSADLKYKTEIQASYILRK